MWPMPQMHWSPRMCRPNCIPTHSPASPAASEGRHDLVLILLDRPVSTARIALPSAATPRPATNKTTLLSIGYGQNNTENAAGGYTVSSSLQRLLVSVVPLASCAPRFGCSQSNPRSLPLAPGILCAGGVGMAQVGRAACRLPASRQAATQWVLGKTTHAGMEGPQHGAQHLPCAWCGCLPSRLSLPAAAHAAAGGVVANHTACRGDSGSPLIQLGQTVSKDLLYAVFSFMATPCGVAGGTGGYTFVPFYRPWIDAQLAAWRVGLQEVAATPQ